MDELQAPLERIGGRVDDAFGQSARTESDLLQVHACHDSAFELCALQVGALQIGVLQQGSSEVGARELGAGQLGPLHRAVGEIDGVGLVAAGGLPGRSSDHAEALFAIRPGQHGLAHVGVVEIGAPQVGVSKARPADVGPAEVGRPCVGVAEVGAEQRRPLEVGQDQAAPLQIGARQIGIRHQPFGEVPLRELHEPPDRALAARLAAHEPLVRVDQLVQLVLGEPRRAGGVGRAGGRPCDVTLQSVSLPLPVRCQRRGGGFPHPGRCRSILSVRLIVSDFELDKAASPSSCRDRS